MTIDCEMFAPGTETGCVVALHCSLGSGRQWMRLGEALGGAHRLLAPDICGYGDNRGPVELPTTLASEVELLGRDLADAAGPIHLVGHSYGGAIAFKIATDSPFADRVRSLTLIEPVLPTLLCDNAADKRLHDRFASLGQAVHAALWNGAYMEAIDRFTTFWNGSEPARPLPDKARLRMIEQVERLAFDFMAGLAEQDVAAAAARIGVPTLVVSGGLSPYLTQRIAYRLASIIPGATTRHLPAAGHMLPITHAGQINREIVKHIGDAERLASMPPLSADIIPLNRDAAE
jgi:pimeloyl-ACP methyl ester carboxylesterase